MKFHSRDGIALKSVTEGSFVVGLMKKTQASSEVLNNVNLMSEISLKAKNASFLEKYRFKSTTKIA